MAEGTRLGENKDFDVPANRYGDDVEAILIPEDEQFRYTDTDESPWVTIKANDKKRARINAMRYILSKFEYTNKDHDMVGEPDPQIVKRGRDQIGD